ncbi:MAG: VPLPA-CTERM sorting domain-containing protein [Alphaproteobacteria bacterium]|nr:VPLPA-CTERM sorting domain-containing protein [Alphaproteobacteria bacterium]
MRVFQRRILGVFVFALFASIIIGPTTRAATIISAVDATASSTFSPSVDIGNTIDQSGLSIGYSSGVTDFDAYIALNPTHTILSANAEWFSATVATSAQVTYDLGSAFTIDRIALWNEEGRGILTTDISTSLDGILFTALTTILPTDNPSGVDYPADVFGFGPILARYFRFDADCSTGCGIGEVAFSNVSPVPVPAALPLFLTMLAGMAGLRWWRRRTTAV